MRIPVKLDKHRIKDIGVHMVDQYECSCGWKSASYWDGAEWAYDEWLEHVEKSK